MVINPLIFIPIIIIAVGLILVGIMLRLNIIQPRERKYIKNIKSVNSDTVIAALNDSDLVANLGGKIHNDSELELLFRKAKNPWNMTTQTFNFLRIGGLGAGVILGLISYFLVGWSGLAIFGIIGFLFYFVPKSAYKTAAAKREHQWNQLYQFMWVIKHNASFYDPKKVFNEASIYIKKHAPGLDELVTGFQDFADHWDNRVMDEYIDKNYSCFDIPRELFSIMQISQQTGEFPEEQLNSLRNIILNKMDFAVKETLTMTATQATIRSTPFLLASMAIIVLFPTMMSLLQAFA